MMKNILIVFIVFMGLTTMAQESVCQGSDITKVATGYNVDVSFTQLYFLVNDATGEIIAYNSTGTFTSTDYNPLADGTVLNVYAVNTDDGGLIASFASATLWSDVELAINAACAAFIGPAPFILDGGPVAVAAGTDIGCASSTTTLLGTGSETSNVSYAWTTSDGAFSGATDQIDATASTAGTYTLTVTDNTTGCSNTASVVVNDNSFVPNVTAISLDASEVCPGSNTGFTINGTSGSVVTYSINSSQSTVTLAGGDASISLSDVTQAQVISIDAVSSGTNCTNNSPSVTETISLLPETALTFSGESICEAQSVSFPAVTETGSWSPAVIDNVTIGSSDYVFTPDAGQCRTAGTFSVTVSDIPVLSIGSFSDEGCENDADGSINLDVTGSGTWVFDWDVDGTSDFDDNQNLSSLEDGVYTVVVQNSVNAACSATTSQIIGTTQNLLTPTFDPVAPVCQGETSSPLVLTSTNGIGGTWSPAFDNMNTTTYTFTPSAGQCSVTTTAEVTITVCCQANAGTW